MTRSVDVVVAVHQDNRPVERAVASALADAPEGTRVVVVCHHVPPQAIRRRLPDALLDRVELVPFEDGVASAAGPFNAGLARSRAAYVSIMGSDDFLRPGALRAWLALAEDTGTHAVLARVEHQDGRLVRTPPTRLGRRRQRLDLVKDRLAYRTAPLGLLRRATLEEHDVRLEPGLPTGEDLGFGVRLWALGNTVYAAAAPAYVVGADAVQRVTLTTRPVRADLECCVRLVSAPWFERLAEPQRRAVVVKLVRVHAFGAIANRRSLASWAAEDRADLSACVSRVLAASPAARRHLSLAEERLLAAALDPASPDARLRALSDRRARHGRWDTVATRDPRGLLSAQGPGRLMAASALMR